MKILESVKQASTRTLESIDANLSGGLTNYCIWEDRFTLGLPVSGRGVGQTFRF